MGGSHGDGGGRGLGLSWIGGWLRCALDAMPEGATNFLCWRVVVRRLYAAYERDAYEAHQAVMPPAAFLEHLQRAFPRAKLSDWRWVDGNWERELDGVQAKRLLEPPAARRQRSFSDRPKK